MYIEHVVLYGGVGIMMHCTGRAAPVRFEQACTVVWVPPTLQESENQAAKKAGA